MRRLTPDDWATLRAIRLDALRDAPTAFGSTFERELAFDEADWRRRLDSPNFVAELDGRTVGIIGGYRETPEVLEIVGMWVHPTARGNGVADALVDALHGWAIDEKLAELHLWVTETNASARKLYERWGFTLTGEREALLSDPTLPVVGMSRPVEPSGPLP